MAGHRTGGPTAALSRKQRVIRVGSISVREFSEPQSLATTKLFPGTRPPKPPHSTAASFLPSLVDRSPLRSDRSTPSRVLLGRDAAS